MSAEKMKRLTHQRNSGIKTGYWSPEKKETLVQRLAEYENTGLTPEDVESVNDFEKSQIGILMKKLSEERKKHRWIPVEERLPENDEDVLISIFGWKHAEVGFYDWDKECFYLKDSEETISFLGLVVNAWMPLPEAYKEDEDDKTD